MTDKKPQKRFQSGPLSVSDTMLRFRGRRYKLSHIENLILKRPLFLMGLGMGLLLAGFALTNADLLYWQEAAFIWILAIALPSLTWPFGTLYIHSRTLSTSEGSITWFYPDLAKVQNAIEDVLFSKNDEEHFDDL